MPLLVIEAFEFSDPPLRRLHRREELVHRVEVAQRLVVLDRQSEMRSGIAGFERHRGEVPHPMFLVAPEGLVEDLSPVVDHGLEQPVFVECRAGRTALRAAGIMQPVRAVPGLHAPFDKGGKAAAQMIKPALDALERLLLVGHPFLPPARANEPWAGAPGGAKASMPIATSSR